MACMLGASSACFILTKMPLSRPKVRAWFHCFCVQTVCKRKKKDIPMVTARRGEYEIQLACGWLEDRCPWASVGP